MIFLKYYFWISFIILAAAFLIFKPKKNVKRFLVVFPSKIHYSLSIFFALLVAYLFNYDYQIYCQPVGFSKALLLSISVWLIFNPYLKLWFVNSFFSSILLVLSLYLIAFGEGAYIIFLTVFGCIISIPLAIITLLLKRKYKSINFQFINFFTSVVALPIILLILALRNYFINGLKYRVVYVSVILVSIVGVYYSFTQLKRINGIILSADYNIESLEEVANNSIEIYLTELTLGAHWKYHTKICLYDGRRPPFHNPILVLSSFIDSSITDDTRNRSNNLLYKKLFPENQYKFDCLCGQSERWPNY